MKAENKTSKKIIRTAASAIVRQEMRKWPPDCVGFSYQPKRPEKHEAANE